MLAACSLSQDEMCCRCSSRELWVQMMFHYDMVTPLFRWVTHKHAEMLTQRERQTKATHVKLGGGAGPLCGGWRRRHHTIWQHDTVHVSLCDKANVTFCKRASVHSVTFGKWKTCNLGVDGNFKRHCNRRILWPTATRFLNAWHQKDEEKGSEEIKRVV